LIYKNLNNIAITGGNGTLGMLFPKQCKRLKTRLEESPFKFLNELRNLTPKIKTVIHLAGISSVKKCEENKEMTDKINVVGSLNLLKACNIYGVEHFIFISSSHIYKIPENKSIYINTNYKKEPQDYYGQSKLRAEKDLLKKNKINNITIARVFSVLSKKGDISLLKNLNTKAENSDYSEIKGFANIRDFLSASIIIKKILKILYLTNKPKIINICSGRPTRVIDLAVKIFKDKNCDTSLLLKNNDICKKEYNTIVGKRPITI
jgi:dTDP-4-dehydrorhamnose reductase